MQFGLFLLIQHVFLGLAKLGVGLSIGETQSQIILINRGVLEDSVGSFEVLDAAAGAADDDCSFAVFIEDVFEDEFAAFDAGAPAADEAKEDAVGDVGAYFAFAHVLMQL